MSTRTTFLEALAAVRPVLAHPLLRERWDEPSALAEFTIRGLAGHLVRAVTTVEGYLDGPPPPRDSDTLDAPGYYLGAADLIGDLQSDLHRGIRARGEEAGRAGSAELLTEWDAAGASLRRRLPAEPADRLVAVRAGRVLLLDDYLVTRLVEMLVHTDDLAASIGVDAPPFPDSATATVIACMLEMARRRRGDAAVIRAFSRRERDRDQALRVF